MQDQKPLVNFSFTGLTVAPLRRPRVLLSLLRQQSSEPREARPRGQKRAVWLYLSFDRGCFVVGMGVNFPITVSGSGRNQPGLIAGFDPQQQLRRFCEQPAKVHSRDAQLAKLGGRDRRDLIFLDGEITGVGGHDKYSHTAFSHGRKPTRSLLQKS